MERNIKIIIEYDGTDFFGWQIQRSVRTVQGEIETALNTITGKKVRINGAGRTDRGVHAEGQVASFRLDKDIRTDELRRALNANTGEDIRILECEEVDKGFHARFSAMSRVYRYQILLGHSVFMRKYYLHIDKELDLQSIRESISLLTGERDFTNLSTGDSGKCNLKEISMENTHNKIILHLEADHFLRRMVRGITGLFLEIGWHKIEPHEIPHILKGTEKRPPIAPPEGLFLERVRY